METEGDDMTDREFNYWRIAIAWTVVVVLVTEIIILSALYR